MAFDGLRTEREAGRRCTVSALPQYRCHKVVQAAKIVEIAQPTNPTALAAGSWIFKLGDHGQREMSHEWYLKHSPQVGGYIVQYDDAYISYSPAKAFEEGYTKFEPSTFQQRVRDEKAELDGKLTRLLAFRAGETFKALPLDEQTRLTMQSDAMTSYSLVLGDRIAAFSDGCTPP